MLNDGTDRRKLAAIMFTDMVGYSALAQQNEKLALVLLDEHRKLLRPIFNRHGGREIKTIGDAFLVEFSSALAAVRSALEIQGTLERRNQTVTAAQRIQLRIGIHAGDVEFRENDVFGDGVNIAFRIEPFAGPGEIVFTQQVFDQIKNQIDAPILKLGRGALKNIRAPVDIYRIAPPGSRGRLVFLERLNFHLRQRKPRAFGATLTALLVLAAFFLWHDWAVRKQQADLSRQLQPVMAGGKSRIAVLPFDNFSAEPGDEYFSDGLTEELTSSLSKVGGLTVIARTSVRKYRGGLKNVAEIGRELQVGTVLEGSVRKSGNQIRVTAQLIDVATQGHLWSANYDREFKDIFAIQSEVAQRVAEALQMQLHEYEKFQIQRKPTENLEAYELYLKGRFFWSLRTVPDLKKGIAYFERAVAIDPNLAVAHCGLADSYALLCVYGEWPPKEGFPKAKAATLAALGIDSTLAEAQTSLALITHRFDWDWSAAERQYLHAIALKPRNPTAHHWYALFLAESGRFDEGIRQIKLALEGEPGSPIMLSTLGWIFYLAHRYDDAIKQFQSILRLEPAFQMPHTLLGWTYVQKKEYPLAIEQFERSQQLSDVETEPAGLACAYALAGQTAKAREILQNLKQSSQRRAVSPYYIATIHCSLGELDAAFEWLEKAYQQRSVELVLLKVDPMVANLRSEPRFTDLARRVGIPF
jgi:adenylate cyclase